MILFKSINAFGFSIMFVKRPRQKEDMPYDEDI